MVQKSNSNRHIKNTIQIQLTCIKLLQKLTEKNKHTHKMNLLYIYKQYINLILELAKTRGEIPRYKNLHPNPKCIAKSEKKIKKHRKMNQCARKQVE